MTPERRQHVKEFFYAALERPKAERAPFLDAACAGDEAAHRELSQLISAHEEAGGLLDRPAFKAAARWSSGKGLGVTVRLQVIEC